MKSILTNTVFNCQTCWLCCVSAFFAVFCLSGFTAAQEPVSLGDPNTCYKLIDAFMMLEDPEGNLTIEDVSSSKFVDRFEKVDSRYNDFGGLNLGLTSSVWWIRFDVRAEYIDAARHDWTMVFYNHRFIGNVAVYSLMADHIAISSSQRWFVQKPDTHLSSHHGKNIMLKLPSIERDPRRVYLRVRSDYSLYFTLSIESAADFVSNTENSFLVYGLFYGVLTVVAIFNLLLVLFLHDRSALWYFFFVVSIGLFFLGISGKISAVTKILGPMFYGYFYTYCISMIVGFAVLFARSFLHTNEFTPKLDKGLRVYLGVNGIVLLLLPFVGFDSSGGESVFLHYAIIGLGTVAPLGIVASGMMRLRQGFKPAKLYLAAWGAFALGVIVFSIPWIIEVNSWRAFQVGCSANVLLLTLAIVDRLRILRAQREELSTAKETAESALSESEEKFRSIADSTTAHIAIVQENCFVYANQTFLDSAGMTLNKLKEIEMTDFFSQETVDVGLKTWAEAEEQGKTQFRYEMTDPRGRWFEVNASLVELDGKHAFVTTSFDITERKLAEEQMFRAEKMASLGQIIAGVAHEINNPNNFIYFNLPILTKYIDSIKPYLDKSVAKDPNQRFLNMPYDIFIDDIYKLLGNMLHGSERITSIVADLKNYVRSNDREDKHSQEIDDVIEQVMTLVGKQVRKQVKTFDVAVAPNLPWIKMNAGKIEQVLINLVINAGQAAEKHDSWVRLNVEQAKEDLSWIEISVEDNGAGITEENQKKIFEPFFTTKADESGTGLGLAISQQIVADHGGEMMLRSEVGKGACFTVRLPVSEKPHEG